MSSLIIVESPTKAKTIQKFLPKGYTVISSMGHIRDLPKSAKEIPAKYKQESWATLGINIEKDFQPLYILTSGKKTLIDKLKKELRTHDELLLATDEDREGESIAWHLMQVLKPSIPFKRMVFHEITKEAILKSLQETREINYPLVYAQETRRILDRLVGYGLSPLLWKKIAPRLSAGRVQSVAIRLLVEREIARHAFVTAQYWDLEASLSFQDNTFKAKLQTIDGKRLITAKDFDSKTGKPVANKNFVILDEKQAKALKKNLSSTDWEVANIEEKPSTRQPAAPFITSTLQQEASRKLRISSKRCMQVAQSLYEKGFITYMRTDSVNLSQEAIKAARKQVTALYGKEYLHTTVRSYTSKSKNAQEAHEAIRPAGNNFATPAETGLTGYESSLYEIIWKRTLACQMKNAKQTHIKATIKADDCLFSATGKRIDFPGFFRAYVEGSDNPEEALDNQEIILPPFKKGDSLGCEDLLVCSHKTQPPARYSEASLIKVLETEGVGRPSTYASILDTIVQRGYIQIKQHTLIPTFCAIAVINLLKAHFPDLVDLHFTAQMESNLDEIASNTRNHLAYLKEFYLGDSGLNNKIETKTTEIEATVFRSVKLEQLDVEVRVNSAGAYISLTDEKDPETKRSLSLPNDLPPADLSQEMIQEMLANKDNAHAIGVDPKTKLDVLLLHGHYGYYIQLGSNDDSEKPKRASVPKTITDVNSISLEQALFFLSLPYTLGEDPDTKAIIKIGIGPYGAYILKELDGKKEYRNLEAGTELHKVTLEEALALLAIPKNTRKKSEPLRTLGKHPDDQAEVHVFKGPYGFYIKHNKTNAGVPKESNHETITLEEALPLLAAKEGAPKKKKTVRKTKAKTTKKK